MFYEAARNLDSQPPLRTDHVEACRPRGYVVPHCIGGQRADSKATFETSSPVDKSLIAKIARGTADDIDRAVFERTLSIIVKHRTDLDLVAERVGVKLGADGLFGASRQAG